MKLLSVIHYPVFGGPHNRNIRIAQLLRQAGIDLTVLLPDEPGDAAERLHAAGVPVVTLPLHRIRGSRRLEPHVELVRAFRAEVDGIRSLIREGRHDVVLINGLVNPHAGIAGGDEGVGVVWQLLDTHHPPALRRVLMPLVISRSDVVMSTGTAVAAAHPGALALGDRLVTFFPAVDFELFAPSEERTLAARAELGLGEHAVVVGNVSNLNPMKDHRNFVRAAARIHERRPDVRFVILGAQYEHRTSYVQELKAEAASLGLEHGESLIIHEPGSRVAELEPAFDVFWLTSRPASEGVPTVVGEAMALELPVVATDVGSVGEAVADGVTGTVVPPLDPQALAEATLPYIESAELRRSAGMAGRERALELFSVEACAAAHVEAIERAAAHAAVRRAAQLGRMRADQQPAAPALHPLLACPACRGDLRWSEDKASCLGCGGEYDVVDGIPILLPESEDAWKVQQAAFFDRADEAYEIARPHGTGSLYTWLLGEKFRRSLDGLSEASPGTVVLTACGGSGLDAEYLARAGFRVIASDLSLEAARRTRERAERHSLPITPIVADVEALPFRDRSIDLVYVHDGLHHLETPLRGLQEMLRTARSAVSVNEPARAQATLLAARVGLAEHYEEAGNFIARLDLAEIEAVVRQAGFKIVTSERYAMLYRHEPGRISRILSAPGLFGVARNGLRLLNAVAGTHGNKMTLQAVRREN